MDFWERIAACKAELTDADRRLADVLFADRTSGSFLPAHAVAQRAGVHPSTAGRLARKLGFVDYRDMRASIQDAVVADRDASTRVQKRVSRATGSSLLGSVVDGDIRALTRLPEQISEAEISEAAQLLRDAGRILAFGEGHAASLAELFARRLVRSGYRAAVLSHADWQAADQLLGLGAADAVFAFVFRHDSPGASRVLSYAREAGARTVLMTDRRTALSPCDLALVADRGDPGEFHSLAVPMALCNTLILELSRIDGGRSHGTLSKVDELQRLFRTRP